MPPWQGHLSLFLPTCRSMNPSSRQVLRLLSSINQILVASPDPLSVLEPILNSLAEGLGSPRAVLLAAERVVQSHHLPPTVQTAKAARSLGVTERQMGLRVDKLDIDWRSFRRHGRRSSPG